MKLVFPATFGLLLVFAVCNVHAQSDDLRAGLAARDSGDYAGAILLLERAVTAEPPNVEARLALSETLAWTRRFDRSLAEYEIILDQWPESLRARAGRARVLLWMGRTDEARGGFDEVLRADPRNVDALEGAATAAWWSGDWRDAERLALKALEIDPELAEARRISQELEAISAPTSTVGFTLVDDDQPYRLGKGEASHTFFSDPLTKWTIAAGIYHLDAPDRTERAPYAGFAGESRFPRVGLTLAGSLRLLEFPDGTAEALGSLRLDRELSGMTLSISWQREELLRTRTAIDDHPFVDGAELRISSLAGDGWTGAASLRHLDYFDHNRGFGADLWLLSPRFGLGPARLAIGPSFAYRDTAESRFLPGFPSGVYDPYWTPEDLFEVRGVLDAAVGWERLVIRVHADGGWGEESVTPEAVTREYRPWRGSVAAELSLHSRWIIAAGIGHEATAFYDATRISASVAGRF